MAAIQTPNIWEYVHESRCYSEKRAVYAWGLLQTVHHRSLHLSGKHQAVSNAMKCDYWCYEGPTQQFERWNSIAGWERCYIFLTFGKIVCSLCIHFISYSALSNMLDVTECHPSVMLITTKKYYRLIIWLFQMLAILHIFCLSHSQSNIIRRP